MAIFKMTVKTETAKATKVSRHTLHGADAVSAARSHAKAMAPKGSTQTIKVQKA